MLNIMRRSADCNAKVPTRNVKVYLEVKGQNIVYTACPGQHFLKHERISEQTFTIMKQYSNLYNWVISPFEWLSQKSVNSKAVPHIYTTFQYSPVSKFLSPNPLKLQSTWFSVTSK